MEDFESSGTGVFQVCKTNIEEMEECIIEPFLYQKFDLSAGGVFVSALSPMT